MKRLCYHLARLTLALLFLYAGVVKMADVTTFAGHVAAYQILPYAANYLVAVTLPYIEFMAGVLLLCNRRVGSALMTIGFMTLIFIGALTSVLLRGLGIDCGCFDPGGGQKVTAGVALLRDLALMILVFLIWWLQRGERNAGRETGDKTQLENEAKIQN